MAAAEIMYNLPYLFQKAAIIPNLLYVPGLPVVCNNKLIRDICKPCKRHNNYDTLDIKLQLFQVTKNGEKSERKKLSICFEMRDEVRNEELCLKTTFLSKSETTKPQTDSQQTQFLES